MLHRRALLYRSRAVAAAALNPIGTPTVIASGTTAGTSVTSVAITGNTVAAGLTLVVIVIGENTSTQTISDDIGLTWSSLTLVQPTSGPVVNHRVFICYNATLPIASGNTITVALSVSKRSNYLFFSVDMGGGTPALDFQQSPADWGSGNRTINTPTLATADELVFVPVVVQSAANGSTVSMSGFSTFVGTTGIGSGSSNPRLHVFWQIASATTAIAVAPLLSDNTKLHEYCPVAIRR